MFIVNQYIGFGARRRGRASGNYIANAVDLDGSSDYINRAGDLDMTDGTDFTVSAWFNMQGGNNGSRYIFGNTGNKVTLSRNPANKIAVTLGSTSSAIWQGATTATFTTSVNTGWHHILISASLVSTPKRHMFIDDVEDQNDVTGPGSGGTIDLTTADWDVGQRSDNVRRFFGFLSEVWFTDTYIDITVESNRRKFITAGFKPVDLGADGSTPTGTKPAAYFRQAAPNWEVNKGSGGGFTENGTITVASSSPSDPYVAQAVSFDGINDWTERQGDWTGNPSDGENGMISFWLNMKGRNAARNQILQSTSGRINIRRESDDKIQVILVSGSGTTLWNFKSDATFTTSSNSGWHHFIFAWELDASPVGHAYIDDTTLTKTETTSPTNGNVDWNETDWSMGSGTAGANRLHADVADLYQTNEFLDISVEANRRKFISSAGKPVDLGGTGSRPTGTAPLLFLSGATADWHTNKGSGGGFTERGALTDGASSPSD